MYDKTHYNIVKVISLQLIKINEKKKEWSSVTHDFLIPSVCPYR